MSIATQLNDDAGVGVTGKVGSHDGDGSAEEGERRDGHAAVLEIQKVFEPSFRGAE